MRMILVGTVMIGVVGPVCAAGISGNDILKGCSENADATNAGVSLGYVIGIADDIRLTSMGSVHCIPEAASYGQIHDVACAYIRQHPESRHVAAPLLIRQALRLAWPCKN